MTDHFWDRFDFADTLFLERVDSAEMMRVYVEYVAAYVGPNNGEPIKKLMSKASASRKMLDYFVGMSERLFHDPNAHCAAMNSISPCLKLRLQLHIMMSMRRWRPSTIWLWQPKTV